MAAQLLCHCYGRRMGPDSSNGDASRTYLPAAFLIADHAGNCGQISSRWTDITGVETSRNSGDGWLEMAHPEDRDRLRSEWVACVAGNGELATRVRLQSTGQ